MSAPKIESQVDLQSNISMNIKKIYTLVFTLIFFNFTTSAIGQNKTNFSDDQIYEGIGKTWILDQNIQTAIFKNEKLKNEIMRVGLPNACRSIKENVTTIIEKNETKFKDLALSTLFENFQDKLVSFPYDFQATGGHNDSLNRWLKRQHSGFFNEASIQALETSLQGLKLLPNTNEDWRGQFSDWHFEEHQINLMLKTACFLELLKDTEKKRIVFDGFYKKKNEK